MPVSMRFLTTPGNGSNSITKTNSATNTETTHLWTHTLLLVRPSDKSESQANDESLIVWNQTRRHGAGGFLGGRENHFCRKETRIPDGEDLLDPGERCLHRGDDLLCEEHDCLDERENCVRSGEDRLGVRENRMALEDDLLRCAEDLLGR